MSVDVHDSVLKAWIDVLGVSEDAADEDFFALGGTSITALRLMERIEAELNIQFPLEVLFMEGRLDAVVRECRERCQGIAATAG